MLTNNAHAIISGQLTQATSSGDTSWPITIKYRNGREYTYQDGNAGHLIKNSYLYCGGGDAPESKADINLDIPYIDNLTYSSSSCSFCNWYTNYYNYLACYTRIVINNTNNPIIIKELGIIGVYSNDNLQDENYEVLIAREVLSEPVILNPGETKTFVMEIY